MNAAGNALEYGTSFLVTLPAPEAAKWWVVANESSSRVGNYPVIPVGTGRTFASDGDGHAYLTHSSGANYLKIDDAGAKLNSYDDSSFTYAVVVDLDVTDGGGGEHLWSN